MSVEISSLIDRYTALLKEEGLICSGAVESAFRRVRRHLLIDKMYLSDIVEIDPDNSEHLALIYSNSTLVIRWHPKPSSSTEPGLVAQMLEHLALKPGMRVLEIGAGTGYNAALMAELVSDPNLVTTVDIQEDLVENTQKHLAGAGYGGIHVLVQDGFYGYEPNAPYDRIVATVSCPDLSPHWVSQLTSDSLLLIPLSHGGVGHCPLVRLQKDGGRLVGRVVGYSAFMYNLGEAFSKSVWAFPTEEEEVHVASLSETAQIWHPLFPDLKTFPNPTPLIPEKLAGLFEFHYFLALHRRDTFMCWKGPGLGNEGSFVLLEEDSIKLYGDQASILYEALEKIYQEWLALGKPRMIDYRLEFVPLSAVEDAEPTPTANTWVIDRLFFRQIVRL